MSLICSRLLAALIPRARRDGALTQPCLKSIARVARVLPLEAIGIFFALEDRQSKRIINLEIILEIAQFGVGSCTKRLRKRRRRIRIDLSLLHFDFLCQTKVF